MNQMVGRGVGWFPLDDGTELDFIIQIGPPGYVIVDRHGRRFADEESQALLRHDFYYHLLAFDSARATTRATRATGCSTSRRLRQAR